jgi:glyoxylase-like metal-dependent hydrolase (beta-lactamase superfamily II)
MGVTDMFIRSIVVALVAAWSTATWAAEAVSFKFEKIAEGVYSGVPAMPGIMTCNILVVVGDNEVVLVDGGTERETARKLLADIRTLTDKPVRYLVNTHFHFDHAGANEGFGPEVKILGSEYTARRLSGNPYDGHTFQLFYGAGDKGAPGTQVQQLATLKSDLAKQTDAARQADMRARIAATEGQMAVLKTTKPRAPDIIVKDKYVIPRAAGEVQLLFLGRGHTGGDLVVYLPKERIVATGDFMQSGLAYMGDSYLEDWPKSLEALKQLQFDRVVGGHGPVFNGTTRITAYQGYLRDFAKQAADLKKQGVSAEEASKRMNLSAYKGEFPQAENGAPLPGVIRYYEMLDGKDSP